MGIKDLFSKDKNTSIVSLTNKEDLSKDIESPEYYSSQIQEKQRFEPLVDYSFPENFAKFGSAKKYYTDAITGIYTSYPFDGSQNDKIQWSLTASGIDRYIFESEYPRTNGYVNMGYSYGASNDAAQDGYGTFGSDEYIFVKGGPNDAPNGGTLSSIFANSSSNFYDPSKNRDSNLELDGDTGVCVEFWLKKGAYATESDKQVVFDLWNSASFGSDGYGRFRVETRSTDTTKMYLEIMSGSSGSLEIEIGDSLTTTDDSWHHYAVSSQNSGSSLVTKLYLDGAINQTVVSGTSIGAVTGPMLGHIGSLGSNVSGTHGALGWGKLSGSIDEMRIWKTSRTDKGIGRYWFTQFGGGTNTDDANTDLGVYYKFNEGITQVASADSKVLDYSGRFSDGSWTGYTSGARNTGSAIVESAAATTEFKDPIIYSFHPAVVSLLSAKQGEGTEYDYNNAASIYYSIPAWITEDDETQGNLLNLTQIISSFFDSLYLKIQELPSVRDIQYVSSSQKPYPFTKAGIESLGFTAPELFVEASVLETISSRNETEAFDDKIYDIKNIIYQNIYNNLVYIYKTKGTIKSFRNLLRCYGIDEELVRVNLYVDGATYELEDDYKLHGLEKKFINYAETDRFNGTVYQTSSATVSNSVSFITASNFDHPITIESEVIFPKKHTKDSPLYFETPFVSSSLFGMHTAKDDGGDYTWEVGDAANFQVYAVRSSIESANAKFVLKSTSEDGPFPTLETSIYKDIYDNNNWNFAVRLRQEYEILNTGSIPILASANPYTLEFYGVETEGDFIRNEFSITSSLAYASGSNFIKSNKRLYAGSHYTNFTGSNLEKADTKITSNRVWLSYLDDEVMRIHARDATNYGTKHPFENSYAFYDEIGVEIPEIDTLALNWGYDTLSSSDGGSGPGYTAGFFTDDLSSGSTDPTVTYGSLDGSLKKEHPGKGNFFLANDTNVIQKEYLSNAKLQGPEVMQSDDLVQIINEQDDQIFTRDSRPLSFRYAVEKGMQQVISDEMIDVFGSIIDFNNFIGEPVNRYRQDYKDLGKLRQIFFSRIQNTPNLIKYVDFYKWIDGAITSMVEQLIPASANFSPDMSTVVESHILERNKYYSKFPTIEFKGTTPEAPALGQGLAQYPIPAGNPGIPRSPVPEGERCYWWQNRASGEGDFIPASVFANREQIVAVTHNTWQRQYNSVVELKVDGLINTDEDANNIGALKFAIRFGSDGFISISADQFQEGCEDG